MPTGCFKRIETHILMYLSNFISTFLPSSIFCINLQFSYRIHVRENNHLKDQDTNPGQTFLMFFSACLIRVFPKHIFAKGLLPVRHSLCSSSEECFLQAYKYLSGTDAILINEIVSA